MAYGWNVLRIGMRTTSIALSKRSTSFARRKAAPHSSSSTVISATVRRTSKTRQPLTANRWAKTKFGLQEGLRIPEDAKFFVPDGVYDHFASRYRQTWRRARQKWVEIFERTARNTQTSRPKLS